ncbi:MAG: AAA family ATPase [Candidatus Cryosericum sp.]
MQNPFTDKIAAGDQFCDRDQERAELSRLMRGGHSAVLLSPRRYGKSSLALATLAEMRAQGLLTAYVDVMPVSSERELVERLARGVAQGFGWGITLAQLPRQLGRLFGHVHLEFSLDATGPRVSAILDPHAEGLQLLEEVLEQTCRYAEQKGRGACVVLDEFQEITQLEESRAIEATMRSVIQQHQSVAWLYVGSRRHLLLSMFADRNRPFFGSASIIELHELPEEAVVPWITAAFARTGKVCSEATARRIHSSSRGYAYYVQRLASTAWDLTDELCTDDIVDEADAILLRELSSGFEIILSSLSLTQKRLLQALAQTPTDQPYAADFLSKSQLSVGAVQKAIRVLIDRDLIERRPNRQYQLVDALLAQWLTQRPPTW